MEVSTIVLAILRANFFTPVMQLVSQSTFALLFFVCRIIISPVVHYEISTTMLEHSSLKMGECFPILIFYVTVAFGLFFHGLNLFWFVKLVKKIRSKLLNEESLEMKDLNEE